MGDSIWDSPFPLRRFKFGRHSGVTNIPDPTPEQVEESKKWVDTVSKKIAYGGPKVIKLPYELTREDLLKLDETDVDKPIALSVLISPWGGIN